MTFGHLLGTNGDSRISKACVALVVLFATLCTVNALSLIDDAARDGARLSTWRPFGTEYTSFVGLVAALPVAVWAARLMASTGPVRRSFILIAGSLLYSLVHVGMMIGLRQIVWWFHEESYGFDYARQSLYEYRKDMVGYAAAVAFLFFVGRWPAGARLTAGKPAESPRILLANGRRRVEIDLVGLIAVEGGGNYAELLFEGGRTRLLRTTLAATERALVDHGFRRTHKSWLVRLAGVRGVRRTASGDYCLMLSGGIEAPLSRRNSALLEDVKALSL